MSLTWGTVSGWWVPACIVLGLLYAWLMYRKPVQLVKGMRYALFACRALVVSFLALLIVSPLVRSTSYLPQKPVVLIAQDNSESIKLFGAPPKPSPEGRVLSQKVSPIGGDLEGALATLKKSLAITTRSTNFILIRT